MRAKGCSDRSASTDVLWRVDPQGVSGGGNDLYLQPRDMAKIGYL